MSNFWSRNGDKKKNLKYWRSEMEANIPKEKKKDETVKREREQAGKKIPLCKKSSNRNADIREGDQLLFKGNENFK